MSQGTLQSVKQPISVAGATAYADDICLVPSAANGYNVTVDCEDGTPNIHDNQVIGYSEDGTACNDSNLCALSSAPYGWTISASDTDPLQNSGVLPAGLNFLYLWFYCSHPVIGRGNAAEFDFEITGSDLQLLGLNFYPGNLNAGTVSQPLIAMMGCPDTPRLVTQLVTFKTGPVSVESETWSNVKEMYR